jgi:hypothetical protein
MGLCKWLKSFCKKEEPVEMEIDRDRQAMRDHFHIVDKYLIEYSLEDVVDANYPDGKKGFVVFIDQENDVDWKSEYDETKYGGLEGEKRFYSCICQLDIAHATPCYNLDEERILTFKKILGAGYASAINGDFEQVPKVIDEALKFVQNRNAEKAREYFLTSSGIFLVIVIIIWVIFGYNKNLIPNSWSSGICMGVMGAYVSIWTRYGKEVFTGLSSKRLHYLEAISRLCVGAIFAIVVMLAMNCKLIFHDIASQYETFAYPFAGFVAGFCERLVPSLMERITKNEQQDDK